MMNVARETRMRLSRLLLILALGGLVVGLVIAGGQLLGEQSALAAGPITVNSTADDTLTNLAVNTTCDLREAIVAANTDAQVGQCNVGGGAAATINITSTGAILLTDNLPTITDTLTINGPGAASLTIDGAGSYRHFRIASGTWTEISGLTMANGYRYTSAGSSQFGGAVRNAGILTLNEVSIVNSIAAAATGYGGYGGAVYSTGGLTITNSSIYSNAASTKGGGIYAEFNSCFPPTTTLIIINSTVYSNTAGEDGGGIYVSSDSCWPVTTTLMLTGSTVNGNFADDGGGIYLYYTSARLLNTTVSDNRASWNGGGIGTLADWDQTVDLVNCTIYTNTASNNGGGMQLESTFIVNVKNTIVAGNGADGVVQIFGGKSNPTTTIWSRIYPEPRFRARLPIISPGLTQCSAPWLTMGAGHGLARCWPAVRRSMLAVVPTSMATRSRWTSVASPGSVPATSARTSMLCRFICPW